MSKRRYSYQMASLVNKERSPRRAARTSRLPASRAAGSVHCSSRARVILLVILSLLLVFLRGTASSF